MTNNPENMQHFGMVRSVNDNTIEVEVNAPIACSSCQVSSSCGLSSDDLKIITIQNEQHDYNVGEHVEVVYEEKLSSKALIIVYIAPLILILLVMIIVNIFTNSDLIIGLSMILSLVPYFLLFKYFNSIITKVFAFSIQKMDVGIHTNKELI